MAMGLAVAALIMSSLSLLLLIPLAVMFVAKHYFSEHVIERVPVDFSASAGDQSGMTMGAPLGHGRPDFAPPFDPFKEIGEPLTEAEQEYFSNLEKRRAKSEAS